MCKTLESVVRLYHDARFYIHFMENITRTTQIFSYKGSEKTLLKDSKAKSYPKFKRLNNKKGQIFVNCPLWINQIFSVKLFKRDVLYLCPVLYFILSFLLLFHAVPFDENILLQSLITVAASVLLISE